MLGRTADTLIARFGWQPGLRLLAQMRLAKYGRKGRIVRADVPSLAAPTYLRARTSDALVLKELLIRGDYDAATSPPAGFSPRFIIDAGANVGLVSALLATRFPDAQIVALEIDAANFAQLRRNTQWYVNAIPLHAALWSHATTVGVANPESREWAYRAAERPESAAPDGAVPALGVGDIMTRFGVAQVDLLKVDIEGGEVEVFGPEAEEWIDRVAMIVVELHDRFVPGCERVVTERLRGRFTRSRFGELDLFVRSDLASTPPGADLGRVV